MANDKYEAPPELSAEDDAILDAVWDAIATKPLYVPPTNLKIVQRKRIRDDRQQTDAHRQQ